MATSNKPGNAGQGKKQSAEPVKDKNNGAAPKEKNGNVNSTPNEGTGKLKEFFLEELKDIYWAEKKLIQTLPKMAEAATSEDLRDAFTTHLEETEEQVGRLEQIFQILGQKAQGKKCDAMEGITAEGASVIEDTEEGTATRDVALILAGQKAEHYEIATYGGLSQVARTLGLEEVADLLDATLEEEKNADELLSELAEGAINQEATEE